MKRQLLFAGLLVLAFSCVSQKNDTGNGSQKDESQNLDNNKAMDTERLTYFSFDQHNAMAENGENYSVSKMKDGRIRVIIDETFPDEKEFYLQDSTIFDEILALVKAYKMDDYKADYRPEWDVFDGDSWSLYYKYDSKRSVSSGGYMAWPDNYGEAHRALSDYFQKWRDWQIGVVAIDCFKFTCRNNSGRDIEYTLQRGEEQATMILRDAERGVNKTLQVSNDNLQELYRLCNVVRLKESMYDYHTDDENATRCTYFVLYNTGDSISGYTCYTQSKGRKESAIGQFFSQWQE